MTKRALGALLGAGIVVGCVGCAADAERKTQFDAFGGGVDRSCSEPKAITLDETVGSGMADKTLALTFDDGPSEATAELSKFLKDQDIAVTFFVNGSYITGREAIITQQVADGHLLGNHTHTHAALTTLTAAQMVTEVEKTDLLLAPHVPAGKLFFRPPFGDWNGNVVAALAASPMQKYEGPVGWDIGDKLTANTAADWDCWDEQNVTKTVPECGALYVKEIKTKKKGVVLMHDGPPNGHGPKTLEMVKLIIPQLKADGYAFKRIDQVPLRPAAPGEKGTGGESGKPKTTQEPAPAAAAPPANQAQDPCAR